MTYFNDEDFDKDGTEIPQNVENTLDRVVNDYSEHWKGVIGEWLQNAYDGWCHNRFGRQRIPETQPLRIRIDVDLSSRTLRATDNAGGMPEDVFHQNFAGLDTPGEEKQSGDFGGSYGRGSHVIAGLGEQMYAETRHGTYHGALGIRGATKLDSDPEIGIDYDGTLVEVVDCDPKPLVKLTDIDAVTTYIQARFNSLLQHENVTVEYVIDGVEHTIEPLNFDAFDVLWETEELKFEYGNEEYILRDVVIYDATSSDEKVPISGIAMLKSNAHMDMPFMRVQDYRPRQLRHMDKMFGVCDASDLCPEHEDNAHNSFTGNIVSRTDLKAILERLEREHFIGTPTDLAEKEDIVNTTLEVVNSQWEYNPFGDNGQADTPFTDGLPTDDEATNDTDDTEDDDDTTTGVKPAAPEDNTDDDERIDEVQEAVTDTEDDDTTDIDELIDWASDDEQENNDTDDDDDDNDDDEEHGDDDELETPELSCSTRQRSFNADEDVNIWVFIENPDDTVTEEFRIEASVTDTDTESTKTLEPLSMTVETGMGTTGDDKWTLTPDSTGKYTFTATLYDDTVDPDDDEAVLDTTHTWYWVGRDAAEDDQEPDTVAFLEDIVLVRSDDDDFRAELNDGDRGMIMVANTRHPEYKHAVRIDGRTGTKNQKLALIRWAHESIMMHLLLDEIDEGLADVYTTSGESMKEKLGGFVRENMIEQMAALTAGAHEEV